MGRSVDLTGQRFGRWIVLERAPRADKHRNTLWRARCDCEAESQITTTSLIRGKSQSCGCGPRSTRTHGMSGHELFATWSGIVRRCTNPKSTVYSYYGGRGIGVHAAWLNDPARFVADVEGEIGPRPKGRSLDRVDGNGHYEPGNLRWADRRQQMANTRPKIRNEQLDAALARIAELEAELAALRRGEEVA